MVMPRLSGAVSLNGERCAGVCVVGAGLTGLSAALYSLEAGRSACVLGAHEAGHGGSGRNVGLINVDTWTPLDEVVATLDVRQEGRLNVVLGRAPALMIGTIECLSIDYQLRCEGILRAPCNVSGVVDLQRHHT